MLPRASASGEEGGTRHGGSVTFSSARFKKCVEPCHRNVQSKKGCVVRAHDANMRARTTAQIKRGQRAWRDKVVRRRNNNFEQPVAAGQQRRLSADGLCTQVRLQHHGADVDKEQRDYVQDGVDAAREQKRLCVLQKRQGCGCVRAHAAGGITRLGQRGKSRRPCACARARRAAYRCSQER